MIRNITTLTTSKLNPTDFKKTEPVLIKNLAKDWPAKKKWTFDYFAKTYPDTKIRMHDDKNYYDKPEPMALRVPLPIEQIVKIIKEVDKGNCKEEESHLYAAGWAFEHTCPELNEDITFPDFIADNILNRIPKVLNFVHRFIFFSHQRNLSRLHTDPFCVAVYFTIIAGKKTVRLISPEFNKKVKPNINLFDDNIIDQLNKDGVTIIEASMEAGDTLFIPPLWWHSVRCDEPAIALSELYVGNDEFIFFENEITKQLVYALQQLSHDRNHILQTKSLDDIMQHYEYLLSSTDLLSNQKNYMQFFTADNEYRTQLVSKQSGRQS